MTAISKITNTFFFILNIIDSEAPNFHLNESNVNLTSPIHFVLSTHPFNTFSAICENKDFCGGFRFRSHCTELAAWSLIYTIRLFRQTLKIIFFYEISIYTVYPIRSCVTFKYTKFWRKRPRIVLRMVSEYRPGLLILH